MIYEATSTSDYYPMNVDDTVATLENYCEFGEDRVYLLMAIARTKENPQLTGSSAVTFREVVTNQQDIRATYDRLRWLVEGYQADIGEEGTFRLYVTVNARNTVDGYFNFQEQLNRWVKEWLKGDDAAPKKFQELSSYWLSELQKPTARDDSRFLFDLDSASEATKQQLIAALEAQTPVLTVRETPNGYHIVTEPFNYTTLEAGVEYELKTDGMLFVEFIGEE